MGLSKKIQNIGKSLTLELTEKANELRQKGIDIISFALGEPDFNTDNNIINAAIKAMEDGKTKYTVVSGIKELKSAIVDKLRKDNNLLYNNENIIVSAGAKQCLVNALLSLINPGDEILIPVPYWVSYPEMVKMSDGIPVFIETKEENDFKVTGEMLVANITSKTKALILNSPNNPTGAIYSKDELENIARVAKEKNIYIISDEIYEKLLYDESKHISIASISDDAFNRTIVINGFSKSYAMTGWRVGYAAGNKDIIKLMSAIQSHMTSNVNTIAQYAALEALQGSQEYAKTMIDKFKNRRDFMINFIKEIPKINYIEPKGAFYIFVDISKLLEEYNINGSIEFSRMLLEEGGVAVVPGVAFGKDNFIRLSYTDSLNNIEKGMKKMKNFVESLKNN